MKETDLDAPLKAAASKCPAQVDPAQFATAHLERL